MRTEKVFPPGLSANDCRLSHTRPVWRLENGRAVLVAYEVYRGPNNRFGKIPGVLGRSEFAIEIVLAIAYQVYMVGLSFDKVCLLMNFFQDLKLRKSQAGALVKRLARAWEGEFNLLCTLLAHSLVVQSDETRWSIRSVWAFLSEKVRVVLFGVHKDAATLAELLAPATFEGILISDDAAVYANFTHAQLPPTEGPADDYRKLCEEIMRLLLADQLFTFVTAEPVEQPNGETMAVPGTNNEAERTLRAAAQARVTGRTSKTVPGARCRTVLVSVLESLRVQLSTLTLSSVIEEVGHWFETGRSCFGRLAEKLGLPSGDSCNEGDRSLLDRLLPVPGG